ncbi:MAG: hypothetical protein HN644_11320 [Rhodospirillales bacterium]|jgi:hypothetical protein|nr:hypothetical protein [Rhodospirillales bacterium]MBT4039251.1 hypothetical protein [Rhodospirillales bacterium]MBT4626921.1 hypothetical protein [Rhodospirillales bacterium]MBT5352487.1 hypothetical protein [Rhodospirillales bacterium]MBT5521102.1 hypothetical protein [Rhodospirillales bacterium]
MADDDGEQTDEDRDSLYSMRLSMVPLETASLKRARLIKNAKLESVIEIFSSFETGSGQLSLQDLPAQFGWDEYNPNEDYKILKRMFALPSYDVYSLRLALRELEIDITDSDALKLSETKSKELSTYMTKFTRPLIMEIYGDSADGNITSFDDVLNLFRSPDVNEALTRLKQMADKLEIRPEAVPDFLEEYGDIFMAISYYRQCLDTIEPVISDFLDAMRELRGSFQFKENKPFMDATREMEAAINEVMAGVTGRFESFDRASETMWDEISAERFREVSSLIRGLHRVNGGVLCALWVKMTAWETQFPSKSSGSPAKRGEFLLSDLRHGMDKMLALEASAPKLQSIR